MTAIYSWRRFALLLAAHLIYVCALAAPMPALAMQILDAADHAELAAEISATEVNRIALAGDRIARIVRAPDGSSVEHDSASGDLYIRPVATGAPGSHDPVTLFVGTEKGFTYRLTLTPAARGSAQILIRNADAMPGAAVSGGPAAGDLRIAALVKLVRAVARRQPLPGYAIETGLASRLDGRDRLSPIRANGPSVDGLTVIETWRGARFAALVFEAARPASPGSVSGAGMGADGGAGLAGTIEALPDIGRVAALWLSAPGAGPSGGRLGVAVAETASRGGRR